MIQLHFNTKKLKIGGTIHQVAIPKSRPKFGAIIIHEIKKLGSCNYTAPLSLKDLQLLHIYIYIRIMI